MNRQILQNRYGVLALLGQGGMGAVYKARDLRLNTFVAIKELLPPPGLAPEMLTRLRAQFAQEANVLARLNHPHLVTVNDYFEEGGKSYLVMRFVDGVSLADCIAREGTIPEAQVLIWATQILDALAYCHAQRVLHRDVKPQNIIIRPDGCAVLVDFGLVKLWNPADPQTRTAIRGAGTPEYAPPEQYSQRGGHTDPRSDIYSLGATLYHALVGRAPLSVTDRMAFPQQFKTPQQLNGLITANTDQVIQRAMALPQDARWSSAAAMATVLRGTVPSGLAVTPTSPAPRRVSLWFWGAGATVVLVVLAIGSSLLGRASAPASSATTMPEPTRLVASEATSTRAATPDLSPTAELLVPPHTATFTTEPTANSTVMAEPTASPTVAPTFTSAPTETPAATVTPSCPTVQGPFAVMWDQEQSRLGCARGDAFGGLIAEETFERGKMFWREPIDTAQALVLFNNGTWRIFTHTPYVEGSPEFSCVDANTPAQCPPTPKRGFGMMWCDIAEIRNGLGNALDCERGYQGSMQQFELGSALRTDTGQVYVFYSDGSWRRW